MLLEWDEAKRRQNVQKHGLDFEDARELFEHPMLVTPDERFDYGEDRWIGIGVIKTRTVVAVYTERGAGTVRMISLRKASSRERARYEQAVRNELG